MRSSSSSEIRSAPAVDGDAGAADEYGVVAREEQHHFGHVDRLAHASRRRVRDAVVPERLVAAEGFAALRRHDRTGLDVIRRDPEFADVRGERARERREFPLGLLHGLAGPGGKQAAQEA